jgi:hypothetical protein
VEQQSEDGHNEQEEKGRRSVEDPGPPGQGLQPLPPEGEEEEEEAEEKPKKGVFLPETSLTDALHDEAQEEQGS